MRIRLVRRRSARTTHLIEVVAPRANAALLAPAEHLFANCALGAPFAVEVTATATARRFLVRAGGADLARAATAQLHMAYPQADLRTVELGEDSVADPARCFPGEVVAACALTFRAPEYLPIRTWTDAEIDAMRAPGADPILGILGALGGLPDGWRASYQLAVASAPDGWARRYLRLALERPLAAERGSARPDGGAPATNTLAPVVLVGLALGAWQVWQWYEAGDWSRLAQVVLALLTTLALLATILRLRNGRAPHDPQLVAQKVARPVYHARLRLLVVAPADASPGAVRARLDQLAAAFQQFTLAAGNGFRATAHEFAAGEVGATLADPLALVEGGGTRRGRLALNTRELAGLWHLPQAGADVPLLARTAATRRAALPAAVAEGCPIGVSAHQGYRGRVRLPDEILRGHLLLVAKTQMGKSSLLLHCIRHLLDADHALLVVDPHSDLARSALALVPPGRAGDVIYLDLGDMEHPCGLNLIDADLGWGRDLAVANTLDLFKRQFPDAWGFRMEDAFRHGLLTLYHANERRCTADPAGGRDGQYTILDLVPLYTNLAFRRRVLREEVADPAIADWWGEYIDPLGRREQLEIFNPVLSKINRFGGTIASRHIVGQPRSTINPREWASAGRVVIVDGAAGIIGEDTTALVCGALLNLARLAVAAQVRFDRGERPPLTIVVDEFHAIPGADYEHILTELAKYGANLLLATQSLARLDALDFAGRRALKAAVFATINGLCAFHTSAEDAAFLIHELDGDGALAPPDLTGLGAHRCYIRMSSRGERHPAFLVELDPPPTGDPATAARLARTSALRWGTPRAAVEAALAEVSTRRRALRELSSPDLGPDLTGGAGLGGRRNERRRPDGRGQKGDAGRATGHDAGEARAAEGAAAAPEDGE